MGGSISVIVDTSELHGDSIVVEISDEQGTAQTYQLAQASPTAGDDLMEVMAAPTVLER